MNKAFVTILFFLLWASFDFRVNSLDQEINKLQQVAETQSEINQKILDRLFTNAR